MITIDPDDSEVLVDPYLFTPLWGSYDLLPLEIGNITCMLEADRQQREAVRRLRLVNRIMMLARNVYELLHERRT